MMLYVMNGAQEGKTIPLNEADTLIGRASNKNNHVVLDFDGKISGVHARVIKENNLYLIIDQNSTHGIWLNQQPINTPTPINMGDVIEMGDTLFLVCELDKPLPPFKMAAEIEES